ncbi:MAG: hypothetical protein AAF555_08495 [Verrucomicrobiota bacterium]
MMRLSPLPFALLAVFSGNPSWSEESEEEDPAARMRLHFADGSQLSGALESTGVEEALVWKSPLARDLITFDQVEAVQFLEVLRPAIPLEGPEPTAMVTLTNGDRLPGILAGFQEKELALETRYAGRLQLPKGMVERIDFIEGSTILYRGPKDLENWEVTSGQNSWELEKGALRSNRYGAIGRNMGLSDRVTIEFRASWEGMLNLSIHFFNEAPEINQMNSDSYMLRISSQIELQRRVGGELPGGGLRRELFDGPVMGNRPVGERFSDQRFRRSGSALITIYADRSAGRVLLYADDRRIASWEDGQEFLGEGQCLTFQSNGSSSAAIEEIEITQWNGIVGQPDEELESDSDDQLEFKNRDKAFGSIAGFKEGSLLLKTAEIEIEIPLERLRGAAIRNREMDQAKRELGDVRAWFRDGGRATFVLRSYDPLTNRMVGYSQNFGEVELQLDAFREIEFNLYPTNDFSIDEDLLWEGFDLES